MYSKKCVKPTVVQTLTSVPSDVPSGISIQVLNTHNSLNDCWVVFQNNVYDLTSWVVKHPGGSGVYTSLCGTSNFESSFITQHGNSKESRFFQETTLIGNFV